MQITAITATAEEIRFTLDAPVTEARLHISLFPAAVGEEGELCSVRVTVQGDSFSISRRLSGQDGLYCRYVVFCEHGEVEGKKYVECLETPRAPRPYPSLCRGVILRGEQDVPAVLSGGMRHAALFISLSDFLMLYPEGENTIFHRTEGRDYYIRKSAAEYADQCLLPLMQAGVSLTLILVNARAFLYSAGERLWGAVTCPDADAGAEYALFDTVRESGLRYFRAFVSFLQGRYDPACMVIGYDVNDPAYTAGEEDSLIDFAERYVTALRVAYQCTGGGTRICAAVTDHECQTAEALLTALAAFSRAEADFPWHVALHPTEDAAVQAMADCLASREMQRAYTSDLFLTEVSADFASARADVLFSVAADGET